MANIDNIEEFILKNIQKHPSDIVALTTSHFDVTRTTVHRYLNTLIENNSIVKTGSTKNTQYFKSDSFDREIRYKITNKLSEFDVYINDFADICKKFSENIENILHYGFTEIFNNALEHARAKTVTASSKVEGGFVTIKIKDDGIGVFKSLYDYFQLDDLREGILQLNKGKMTTDPVNHTGEGIFFSSKAFDIFEIYSNGLHYVRNNIEDDWALASTDKAKHGSLVVMSIRSNIDRRLTDIFRLFEEPDDHGFDRTEFLVELSRFAEESFISRSQAKRVIRGLEKFDRVTLDFKGVKLVGQGFVDEVFRVFANLHPTINIDYINATDDVEFMIKRGLARK